jgi:hypothetical protein
MALIGWLWLGSPFLLIALISRDPELLRLVAIHHRRCQIAGWSGVAVMLLGVTLVPGWPGRVMFVLGTPLAGLAVWGRRDGGDDGGQEAPDVPPIDWDEFERSFWSYVRRRGRPPRRPRTPSPG